tara:strand:- start:441 stop:929 length:489 start_codon:yes stop_codon:yes gene_type:complete
MIVFLSLGSNIGNRLDNFKKVYSIIEEQGKNSIISKSRVYETSPMENLNQNQFLNQVIKIKTELNPLGLLNLIKRIEIKMGRINTEKRYMPRIIDIDILAYDSINIDTDKLSIPHPKIKSRKFILKPWTDIAPDYILSNGKSTIKELFENISHFKDEVKEYN